jgi:uncharacterized protein
MENKTQFILPSFILGICIVASFTVLGWYQKQARVENTLAVTGSSKQRISSDRVKWVSSFTRTVGMNELKSGYSQMKADQDKVESFLTKKGIGKDAVNISAVFVEEPNRYNPQGPQTYSLRQTVEVKSSEVVKISDLAKNLQEIIDQGIIFSTQSLEYTYSKLPELRVSMLEDAVKDAKARAEKIASSTGKSLGSAKSATQGVVQLLPPESNDVSDYGAYDSQSIEKDAMVTVKLNFELK